MFTETDAIGAKLIDRDMVPIITHAERNRELQRPVGRYRQVGATGCCVQATAGSWTGMFVKAARGCVDKLMERGLTHFVASDAHDVHVRSPSLLAAYSLLATEWGKDLIRPLFVDNPRAVLSGNVVDVEPERPGVKRRKWYQFWRGTFSRRNLWERPMKSVGPWASMAGAARRMRRWRLA